MPALILIADDNEDNRELMRFVLRDARYDVREASDGQECLQVAREQQPDLIMIDLSMPMLDGWEVFRELKADERTSDIPCVAVTAYAEGDRHQALETGFNAYLTKPFRTDALLDTVQQVLGSHALKANAAEARIGEQ